MKKLGKLNINPHKILEEKELLSLQGGYGASGWLICRSIFGGVCWEGWAECNHSWSTCTVFCPPWESAICVG